MALIITNQVLTITWEDNKIDKLEYAGEVNTWEYLMNYAMKDPLVERHIPFTVDVDDNNNLIKI